MYVFQKSKVWQATAPSSSHRRFFEQFSLFNSTWHIAKWLGCEDCVVEDDAQSPNVHHLGVPHPLTLHHGLPVKLPILNDVARQDFRTHVVLGAKKVLFLYKILT